MAGQDGARVPGLTTAYVVIAGAVTGLLALVAMVLAVVTVTKDVAGVAAIAATVTAFFTLLALVLRLVLVWVVDRAR